MSPLALLSFRVGLGSFRSMEYYAFHHSNLDLERAICFPYSVNIVSDVIIVITILPVVEVEDVDVARSIINPPVLMHSIKVGTVMEDWRYKYVDGTVRIIPMM